MCLSCLGFFITYFLLLTLSDLNIIQQLVISSIVYLVLLNIKQ